MQAFQAVISGRVQLVMYRDFAKRKADERGINGYVKNNDDGTVLVVAEGEKAALQQYLKQLREGPILARVDEVAVQSTEPSGQFDGFSIRYS